MSEWKKVKLGDCCFIGDGAHASLKRQEKGILYITAKNLTSNGLDYSRVDYISEELYNKHFSEKNGAITRPIKNDIIFSIIGSLGDSYLVKDEKLGISSSVAIFRSKGDILPLYLFYYLKSEKIKSEIDSIKGGVAQGFMSLSKLGSLTIYLPTSLKLQQRIAETLSRYDSLIENYQKQIKLLEESAQRLYKEWFIDLRFPGHENAKIVDGIPEGWEKKSVDSIYSIKYGKNLSTTLISESGVFPVYGANGVIGYYDKANCNEQVVLITSRGNGSGDVLMTYHKEAFITNNSFIVTPLEEYLYCQLPFTYQFLKCANFRNVRTGAAQPQLTNQSIHTIDVILPTKDVIVEFCKKTDSNNSLIINLKEYIRHLTEARDRLLPKLMGGDIKV